MIKDLEELFKLAGGSIGIAYDLKLHQFTVERWRVIGVPIKYWEFLIKKYDLTPAELYSISEKVRSKNARSK